MNTDLLRFIDSISRDKKIDKDSVFVDLEAAMVSAVSKAYGEIEDVSVKIDRTSGEIVATVEGETVDMKALGRIAAQTAKQVMIQRIREDERNSIFEEYSQLVGTVVTGQVTRYEGGALTVNLGRAEAFLPRSEQIPGEAHHPGERVRAMILDVREEQSRVRIVLTQTHPDYIRKLFELEVPEVDERIIEIRALAREAGYRTKLAVSSIDSKVDAVGACVGVRGSRIRNIVDELGGEKIDIVRWNESSQVLIGNSLKPAEVKETFLCFELGKATVIVDEDQLSLAIGKRGQNVRLAARLTGWDIDILTPAEYNKNLDDIETALKAIEGVEDVTLDKMLAIGIVSLADVVEVGAEPLVKELDLNEDLAARVVEVAAEEAKRITSEEQQARAAATEEAKRIASEEQQAKAAATEEAKPSEESSRDTPETEPVTVLGAEPAAVSDQPESDALTQAPAEDLSTSVLTEAVDEAPEHVLPERAGGEGEEPAATSAAAPDGDEPARETGSTEPCDPSL